MDASNLKLRYFIILTVFGIYQRKCSGYDLRCPEQSEWNLKARAKCGNIFEYFCLLDGNVNKHIEFCKKNPDVSRDMTWKKGHKSVLRGNLDGEACSSERYQPFKFRTDGNSNCAYTKSLCQDEGMILYRNGSTTTDTQCRCDHTNGFAFVSQTKHGCYCIPSQEECSCHKKKCKRNFKLSKDYTCASVYSSEGQLACSHIQTRPLVNIDTQIPESKQGNGYISSESDMNQFPVMIMVGVRHAALAVSVLTGVIIIIFCLGCANIIGFFRTSLVQCIEDHKKKHRTDNLNETSQNSAADGTYYKTENEQENINSEKKNEQFSDSNKYPIIKIEEIRELLSDKDFENEKEGFENKSNHKIPEDVRDSNKCTIINIEELPEELSDTEFEKEKTDLENISNKKITEDLRDKDFENEKEDLENISNNKIPEDLRVADTDFEKEKEHLENISNKKIQEDLRGFNHRTIQEWKLEDKHITETTASIRIKDILTKINCVVVVGCPGSGKSSIIRHEALTYVTEKDLTNVDIFPVIVEPSTVAKYYNGSRKQIFVVDNFCGKDLVNIQLVDVWTYNIESILNIINHEDRDEHTTKIIIACNTSVYEHLMFEPLKKHLNSYVCNLHTIPLTHLEMANIMKIYAPNAEKKEYNSYDGKPIKNLGFPLLCKLSKGKDKLNINRLFENPQKHIKDNLMKILTEGKLQFCAIALCTLFNNKFKLKWLNFNCGPENIHLSNAVKKICLEFDLDITQDTDREKLQNQFVQETYWLRKSVDTYRLMHDQIFNIASLICGDSFPQSCIHHASSSFITNRLTVVKSIEDLNRTVPVYFNRLVEDLERGITYSTFLNSKLKNQINRKKFTNYCRNRKDELKQVLQNIKVNHARCKTIERQLCVDCTSRKETFCFHLKSDNVPLIDCAFLGYETLVDLLLDLGCDVNETDTFGRSALIVASAKGRIKIVKKVIQRDADIALCDIKGRTALHMACLEGHIGIVRCLLAKRAPVSKCDNDGCSLLHVACASGQTKIVDLLLKKHWKMNINQKDNLDRTPIFLASSLGQTDVVKSLLISKAKIEIPDKTTLTPLMISCMNGFLETAETLMKQKETTGLLDGTGRSALLIACEQGRTKIVESLIKKNIKMINQCDHQNKSPLYMACARGNFDIVKMLLDNSAEINVYDKDNRSPLYITCTKGNVQIVQCLLEKNAKINPSDSNEKLPLRKACESGNKDIVRLLLQYEKKLSYPMQWDKNALDMASNNGFEEIVNILNNHKIDMNNAVKTTKRKSNKF